MKNQINPSNTNNINNTNKEKSNMNTKSVTTSNGIVITIKDLEMAIKIADVDWSKAAYANKNALSANPIDICLFDFFEDAWYVVDDYFMEEYDDCDGDTVIALALVIERRAGVWYDWAEQNKESEELCYRVNGEPFSLNYAKLYIACKNIECADLYDGAHAVLSRSFSTRHYSGRNKVKGLVRHHSTLIWGNIEYSVTQYYKDERVKQDDINDLPDFITIKVNEVKDTQN